MIKQLRFCRGRNVYCHRPVIVAEVDLGTYGNVLTSHIGSFNSKLLELLPSLQEHYCSRGRPGGFVERLMEGTLLGHVIEHITLELQTLAGGQVFYGKTISAGQENIYQVVCECEGPKGGSAAVNGAAQIVKTLIIGETVDLDGLVGKIRETINWEKLGTSDEAVALRKALREANPGDVVIAFYEKLQPMLDVLAEWEQSCSGAGEVSSAAAE